MPTADPEEIARFTRMAGEWWDPHGKFKPLHAMNPMRIGYIRDTAAAHFKREAAKRRVLGASCLVHGKEDSSHPSTKHQAPSTYDTSRPLEGLSLLDIGCGGGLICEPMARLGAEVTGIDAGEANIRAAKAHAEQMGLAVNYRCAAAEEWAAGAYDIVLALEIIEHVADAALFVEHCLRLTRPGGLLVLSTINRTPKSFALAIVGAEYVLRWLPRGTHDWRKFFRPSEVAALVRAYGGEVCEVMGMRMHPLTFEWSLSPRDLSVNYLLAAVKEDHA